MAAVELEVGRRRNGSTPPGSEDENRTCAAYASRTVPTPATTLTPEERARLRVEAPAGELAESDWNTLAVHKVALIALLAPDQEPDGHQAEPDGRTTEVTVADVMEVFPGSRVVAIGQPATWPPEGGYIPGWGNDARFGPTPPVVPCPACGSLNYYRAGDGWTCSTCHPPIDPTATKTIPASRDIVTTTTIRPSGRSDPPTGWAHQPRGTRRTGQAKATRA